MRIEVDTREIVEFGRRLSAAAGAREYRFALARGHTRLMSALRERMKARMDAAFILRNSFLKQSLRVERATPDSLDAAMGMPATYGGRDMNFMLRQEVGGTKTPSGRHLSIPKGIRRSIREIIPQGRRPRALLSNEGNRRGGKVFILPGGKYIVKRSGRDLTVLYSLVSSGNIKPTFGFIDTSKEFLTSEYVTVVLDSVLKSLSGIGAK